MASLCIVLVGALRSCFWHGVLHNMTSYMAMYMMKYQTRHFPTEH